MMSSGKEFHQWSWRFTSSSRCCHCCGVSDWGRHYLCDKWGCFTHGSTELPGMQIDAAINSGGPAVNDKGKCVGIAFQSLKHEDVENIGYVIPTPVIMRFIQDYERNGAYTVFPILGVEWHKMEIPDLGMTMGMRRDQKGVRVRRIEPTASESQVLKPSDIIISFDGIDIANDGTAEIMREM